MTLILGHFPTCDWKTKGEDLEVGLLQQNRLMKCQQFWCGHSDKLHCICRTYKDRTTSSRESYRMPITFKLRAEKVPKLKRSRSDGLLYKAYIKYFLLPYQSHPTAVLFQLNVFCR